MPEIVYIAPDGSRIAIEADEGATVMRTAVNNRVPGIVGECGGELQCATCHVYVDETSTVPLPPRTEDEDEMLDAAAAPRAATSRLCCQLRATSETSGLVVRIPDTQY